MMEKLGLYRPGSGVKHVGLTEQIHGMKSKSKSLIERFLDRLIMLPSWISVVLGIVSYVALEWFTRTRVPNLNNAILTVSSSIYPPVALVAFLFTAVFGAIHRKRRFGLFEQQTGLESLRAMQWKEFEHLVAELFERKGYSVDYSLDSGPDGGVDVRLKKDGYLAIVQCKCWRSWSVGVPTVREMFGLLHHEGAQEAIIVTTGDFTEEAQRFAKGKPIQLINGHALWNLVASIRKLPEESKPPAQPACPACGGGMVRRTAKRGAQPGKEFWGCSSFPRCSGSRSMT